MEPYAAQSPARPGWRDPLVGWPVSGSADVTGARTALRLVITYGNGVEASCGRLEADVDDGRAVTPHWLDVAPERVAGWLAAFGTRHGDAVTSTDVSSGIVSLRAADGAIADCHVPFPPLPAAGSGTAAEIAEHASADRTVGVLLVRLGGYAAGVFVGAPPRLAASKVGSRLVHGRSAAGGQSQQRFARRREKQAREALADAADCAVGVFGGYPGRLDAVVLGGDKRSIAALRDDPRLRPYFALAVDRFLTVPDPRLTVLQGTPRQFRAVRIRLTGGAVADGSIAG